VWVIERLTWNAFEIMLKHEDGREEGFATRSSLLEAVQWLEDARKEYERDRPPANLWLLEEAQQIEKLHYQLETDEARPDLPPIPCALTTQALALLDQAHWIMRRAVAESEQS
jgi:hypothetical protein